MGVDVNDDERRRRLRTARVLSRLASMSCDLALDDLERIQALRDLRHMANREMRIIDERVRGIARASVSPKAAKWGQA